MKITLLGSLGHINSYVIPELINQGHEVTVVSHSSKRQAEIESMGAKAAIGSMQDADFLTQAFTGADEVYLMLSGVNQGQDPVKSARDQAEVYKTAIQRANIKRVVDLSSVGADQGPEVGGLYIYHIIEDILRELSDVVYTFVRPTGFYHNLLGMVPMIKEHHAIIENRSADATGIWVDPKDIAQVVLKALLTTAAENNVMYAASDIVTGVQLVKYIADEIKMPDLKWIQISDEEKEKNLEKQMPKEFAKVMTTMSAREGSSEFYADLFKHDPQLGNVKMTDYMKTFGAKYREA